MISDYVASLAGLLGFLSAAGITYQYRTLDGTDLVYQRDLLVLEFMQSACTHLLFIDSDMVFEPNLAEILICENVPLIGVVYTKRNIDIDFLREAKPDEFSARLAGAYKWNVLVLDGKIDRNGPICRVDGVACGFLLIDRCCFDKIIAVNAPPVYGGEQAGMYSFFAEQFLDNDILEGDYAFCRRWAQCGGEVLAYVDADIHHAGEWRSHVSFRSYLDATQATPGDV